MIEVSEIYWTCDECNHIFSVGEDGNVEVIVVDRHYELTTMADEVRTFLRRKRSAVVCGACRGLAKERGGD